MKLFVSKPKSATRISKLNIFAILLCVFLFGNTTITAAPLYSWRTQVIYTAQNKNFVLLNEIVACSFERTISDDFQNYASSGYSSKLYPATTRENIAYSSSLMLGNDFQDFTKFECNSNLYSNATNTTLYSVLYR